MSPKSNPSICLETDFSFGVDQGLKDEETSEYGTNDSLLSGSAHTGGSSPLRLIASKEKSPLTTQSPGSCQSGTGEILCYTGRSNLSISVDDSLGPVIRIEARILVKNLVDPCMGAFHASVIPKWCCERWGVRSVLREYLTDYANSRNAPRGA